MRLAFATLDRRELYPSRYFSYIRRNLIMMDGAFSEYRKKILIIAIMAVIVTSGLAASAQLLTQKTLQSASNSGVQSQLILELTDPPIVPTGTTSLNLTYSAIYITTLGPDQNSPQAISIVPGENFNSVDLLTLENVSQTMGTSNLKDGSQVLAVSFLVSKIYIEINQSKYPVTLATGGNSLVVSMNNPQEINSSREALLLQFNPTIIESSNGYQLVPSSLGFLKPQSEISPAQSAVGNVQMLSGEDRNKI